MIKPLLSFHVCGIRNQSLVYLLFHFCVTSLSLQGDHVTFFGETGDLFEGGKVAARKDFSYKFCQIFYQ